MSTSTITILRPTAGDTIAITVHISDKDDAILEALDEDGAPVTLTDTEVAQAVFKAQNGLDETGR